MSLFLLTVQYVGRVANKDLILYRNVLFIKQTSEILFWDLKPSSYQICFIIFYNCHLSFVKCLIHIVMELLFIYFNSFSICLL